MNLGELRDEIAHYKKAFHKIADMKPVGKSPTWRGAHDGGNYDDCETNGYELAAWAAAVIAEEALKS